MGALKRHLLFGTGAALLLIALYLLLITWAQDWQHALQQTAELWYWVAALAAGFGIQVGLFSFIRYSLRQRRAAATGSVAASGGVSAGAMAACCAHHLADILPVLGLAGAAVFLVQYQVFFIVLGVLSNIIGIIIMLETIQRHGLSRRIARWKLSLNRFKKWAMASAVVILAATFWLTS